MKRFLIILAVLIGFLPLTAIAINITVPQSTGYGQVLIGNAAGGSYTPVATSTLGISSGSSNSGNVATSSAETALQIPWWTTTAGSPARLSGGSPLFQWLNPGLYALSSSTIGDGTQTGGLTISGDATTTGNGTVLGYLNVGTTTPNNTTAGDITSKRLSVGNTPFPGSQTNQFASLTGTSTDISGTPVGMNVVNYINPLSDSTGGNRSLNMSNTFNTTANFTAVGANSPTAGWFESRIVNVGNVTEMHGNTATGLIAGTAALSLGTVTSATAYYAVPVNSFSNSLNSTVTNAQGLHVINSPNSGSGPLTITRQVGVSIDALSAATNNTSLLIGQSTAAIGNFGIYNSSSNNNYFAGNVGIGTTSPAAILDIYKTSSGATADQAYFTNAASATSTAERVNFRAINFQGIGTTTAAITSILQKNFNGGNGDLLFSTLNSGVLTEDARFQGSTGNFGIGTTSPGSLLSLNAIANFTAATSTFYGNGLNLAAGCYAISGTCIGTGSGTVSSGTAGQNAFYAASGTTVSGTSSLFIAPNQFIGIGTTTPQNALAVLSDSTNNAPMKSAVTGTISTNTAYAALVLATLNNASSINDGSGPALLFQEASSTGYYEGMGDLFVKRKGADNTGILTMRAYTAGAAGNANMVLDGSTGFSGVATGTPGSLFSVGTVANFTAATSTFYGTGGVSITSGCYAIVATCLPTLSASQTWTGLQTINSASTTNLTANLTQIIGDGSGSSLITPLRILSVTYATTTAWAGTTTLLDIGIAPFGMTINTARCHTDAGTLNVQLQYGTGPTKPLMLLASSTIGQQTLSANNTPAKGNDIGIVFGTPASSPTQVNCTFSGPQTST